MKRATQRIGLAAALGVAVALSGCFGESTEQLIAQAKTHLEKNEPKAALIQLKNALQKSPESAEARFLLGKVLLQGGDVAGAKIELGKAAELGYDRQLLAPELARLLFKQGQFAKVVEEYGTQRLNDAKRDVDLRTTVATSYIAVGKLDLARQAVDEALKADPDHAPARLLDIRLLAAQNQREAAFKAMDQLLAQKPGLSEAWQIKAEMQSAFGLGSDAVLASYQEAVKQDKNNLFALTGIFSIVAAKRDYDAAQATLKQMQAAAPNSPQVRYSAARLALERNDLKTAQEQVQALLKLTPASPGGLQMAGAIASRLGEQAKAETYLKQALQAKPDLLGARLLLAQTYLRSGDGRKTLSTLQELLDDKNPNPQALAVAAEAHLLLGDSKQAEELFSRATKLNPKDSRSRTALAVAQLGKGDGHQGMDELRALSSSEDSLLPDMALISALVRRNEIEQALKAIDALERKSPGQPTAAALRGRIELGRGNAAKAREAFEAALKVSPGYMPALSSLAGMDVAEKKPEQAVKRFEQLLQKEPQNVAAHMALIGLRAQLAAPRSELIERLGTAIKQNPQSVQPRVALVKLRLDANEAKEALSAAQDGVAALPDNVDMLGALAQAQMAAGDYNQAVSAANKAISLQPDSPAPLLRLAELQMARKDTSGAIQTLKRALTIKPDLMPVQAMLVGLLVKDPARVGEARTLVRGLLTQYPKLAAPLSLQGDLDMGQKSYAAAAASYRKALELQPDTSLAVKLHAALRADGKADEAKRFEAQWLTKYPKDASFHFYLGDQLLAQNNLPQALERYQTVLQIQPDHAVATNNVAWLLFKLGKPGALDYAQRATTLKPGHPAFLDTLAEILAGQGQLDKALETQKKAVEADPNFAMHRLHLAQYYIKAGKKSEAAEQLKQLAALGDKFSAQAEVKKLQSSL